MAYKPGRPCPGKGARFRSCPNIIRGNVRYCPECEALNNVESKEYNQKRGSSASRGYDSTWHKVRAIKADVNPLCELCLLKGIERPLAIVHHIKEVEKFPELRLVMSNLMSLCFSCHEMIHSSNRFGRTQNRK